MKVITPRTKSAIRIATPPNFVLKKAAGLLKSKKVTIVKDLAQGRKTWDSH